jgi:hypothetical protein
MAFLGRDSQRDLDRIDRAKRWIAARSPYAIISAGAGLMAIVDSITLVIGVIAGVAAIFTGRMGLRELKEKPELLGRRLCIAGMVMGILGLALSFAVWMYFRMNR